MLELLRKFIGKGLIFGSILLLVCLSIEYVLYRNTRSHFFIRQADWHLKHPQPIQVLFLGNSRTGAHINLPEISNQWKVPMYILGVEGGGIEEFWVKYGVFAARNEKPKAIVLQLDPAALIDRHNLVDTLLHKERYLSYIFMNNLGINSWLEKKYGYNWYEAYVPLVRYIPFPKLFLQHLLDEAIDPYVSPYQVSDKLIKIGNQSAFEPFDQFKQSVIFNSTLDFQYADSFYQYCLRNKIQLICIYPPQTRVTYNLMSAKYQHSMRDFIESHPGMLYHDFNTIEFSQDSLFRNHMHLNLNGIKLYNKHLVHWLDSVGVRSNLTPCSMHWIDK